eukprot:4073264-Alexandrium_andersonii.AAC.1
MALSAMLIRSKCSATALAVAGGSAWPLNPPAATACSAASKMSLQSGPSWPGSKGVTVLSLIHISEPTRLALI